MAPLLFINKDPQNFNKSKGFDKFLNASHSARRPRRKLPTSKFLTTYSGAITSEDDWTCDRARSLSLVRQIIAPGQHTGDPFSSTAMRIHHDAFSMIHYFLVWTMSRNQVITIKSTEKGLSSQMTTVEPLVVVAKAVGDELHMASLLSFVACLMDAGASDKIYRTRVREMTSQSLRLLRKGLQAWIPSTLESAALIPDILYLAYTALYLREIPAARNHVKAIQILVTSAGGYTELGPHVLRSIIFADICCSLPDLRKPLFDMSKHQFPPVPLTSICTASMLDDEVQLVHETLFQSTADADCKKYALTIVEMAQAVHNPRHQKSDVHWVFIKCLTMLSNLLGSFREDAITNPRVDSLREDTDAHPTSTLKLWLDGRPPNSVSSSGLSSCGKSRGAPNVVTSCQRSNQSVAPL